MSFRRLLTAASTSLKIIASPACREPGPLVMSVLALTGERTDSMGLDSSQPTLQEQPLEEQTLGPRQHQRFRKHPQVRSTRGGRPGEARACAGRSPLPPPFGEVFDSGTYRKSQEPTCLATAPSCEARRLPRHYSSSLNRVTQTMYSGLSARRFSG